MVVGGTASDDHANRVFRALADRTRRDIVRRAMGGTLSASRLARLYPIVGAALFAHRLAEYVAIVAAEVCEEGLTVRNKPTPRRSYL
jgi:hypothetical protein